MSNRLLLTAHALSSHVLRFFLPWACAGCRTPLSTLDDTGFCGRCWLRLPRIQGWVCQYCGTPLNDGGNLCFQCRQQPTKIIVRAATTYSGSISRAIQRFKYAGRKTLCHSLVVLMHRAWEESPELHGIDAL